MRTELTATERHGAAAGERPAAMAKLHEWLVRPVDGASLAAFRVLFGAMMLISVVRFAANGWIHDLYVAPSYHFAYFGQRWIQALPGPGMYLLFGVIGAAALGIALGAWYRWSMVVFALAFTYVQAIDQTTYLNHYYLVIVLAALMAFMPLHHTWSIDARRNRRRWQPYVPCWALWTLRAQVGLVYFFAGVAKLKRDWLLYGEPLHIWLRAHSDLPILGEWLSERPVAIALAWAGAGFDLFVVPALLVRRTRGLAFAAVVLFHAITGLLFPIGLFPLIMVSCATVFFAPDWPRRLWLRPATMDASVPRAASAPGWASRVGFAVLAAHLALQVALPLRHYLYPGNPCWTEQGYRYAWHVMLTEKTGQVDYHVKAGDAQYVVHPRAYLTPLQVRMMSTQPTMILEFAHHLAREFEARLGGAVEVRADAWVSMNGRRSQRLIDPAIDLAQQRDGLGAKPWIVPEPSVP